MELYELKEILLRQIQDELLLRENTHSLNLK